MASVKINSDIVAKVNSSVVERRENKKAAILRKEVLILLRKDLALRDTTELFALLKECTVEEFGKNGKLRKLNPYRVYKQFFTARYAGLINSKSERLPQQQFTSAVIAAVKYCIGNTFHVPTPELKQAWLEVIGEEEHFGVKQVTLQANILPPDYAMRTYLLNKYGTVVNDEGDKIESEPEPETEPTT